MIYTQGESKVTGQKKKERVAYFWQNLTLTQYGGFQDGGHVLDVA